MSGEFASVRCIVSGRVQGVFYRASAAEHARRLGLAGWARNLSNGDVEVVACGDATAVSSLTAWLWQGPPNAIVDSVSIAEWDEPVPGGFTTA